MFNKNIKILIIILLTLIILLIIYLLLNPKKTTNPQEPITGPTPSPQSALGPQPGHSYSYSSQQDTSERLKQETVRKLESKLPYKGQYFVLTYDSRLDTFYVNFSPDKSGQGNTELDDYLKSQGILNRDWIFNLVVK